MLHTVIPVFTASAASLWVAALVATPRKPCLGNEVQELVYSRLLGRQQRLVLLAGAVTAIMLLTLVATMPARFSPENDRGIPVERVCVDPQVGEAC